MADCRVLVNRSAVVGVQLLDQNGAPRGAAGATLTATAERLDGTTVVLDTPVGDSNGIASVSLQRTDITTPDVLVVTVTDMATGTTDAATVEVVGNFYFSLDEARGKETSLQRSGKYPDQDLVLVRNEVEDECERICRQAFVPRAAAITVDGDGTDELMLPGPIRFVRSLSINSIALTADELDDLVIDDIGCVRRRHGTFRDGIGNVRLIVEYGRSAPPAELKAAAILRLRERLNKPSSNIPNRATSVAQEGSTFSIATPGRGGFETGNPEVDAVYARYVWAPVVA